MRFEQEKCQLVRIEGRHSRNRRKWRSLIGRTFLLVVHDMTASAPAICKDLAIVGIGRARQRSENRAEYATTHQQRTGYPIFQHPGLFLGLIVMAQ